MTDIQKDKTINHYHTDPILINQPNCRNTLLVGQFVHIDITKNYVPSIAIPGFSIVNGVVWDFIDDDNFYLKTESGPLLYKFPFIPNWFSHIGSAITSTYPLYQYVPGSLGCKLYLSGIIPGGVSNIPPTNPAFRTIIGYKTEYGILFRPEVNN